MREETSRTVGSLAEYNTPSLGAVWPPAPGVIGKMVKLFPPFARPDFFCRELSKKGEREEYYGELERIYEWVTKELNELEEDVSEKSGECICE